MKTAEAMSKQYLRRTDDGLHYIIVSDAIKMAKKYAQERTKDMYPKEFVEWAINHKELLIKFGGIDKLFIYWKDNIK